MEEIKEVTKKAEFTPIDKIIIVKPILRVRNSLITDPDHEAFFLFGNATTDYCLPVDQNGTLINPFSSKEEQAWLEKSLDLDLNIYKTKENFWKSRKAKVRLGKDDRKLNLSNPKDYISWLVLKTNKNYIAPDGDSINKKATYRYGLYSEEYATQTIVKHADKKKLAYKAASRLEDKGKETMVNFLKVYGHRVTAESKFEFLVAAIDKIIEDDIDTFLKLVDDKEYELKLLISNAVEVGAITKKGRHYFLLGGDPLCGTGETPVLDTVVAYLKAPANGDIVNMLMASIKKKK